MPESYKIRSNNRLPYDFEDGIKVGGVDITHLKDLGNPGGSNLVQYETGRTVQNVLDTNVALADYNALRSYNGRATMIRITNDGIAGVFKYDTGDTASADNGGTIIVSGTKRWKRVFDGSVYPEWFGAKGDGLANDRDALYNALFYACSTGTRFMGGANKTYKINSSISINRANTPSVIIDWNGASVICNNSSIEFRGQDAFLNTTFLVDPVRNDAKVKLANVTGIVQGDMIVVNSPALTQNNVGAIHCYLVSEVDSANNDVYIEGNVVADINQQQIIDSSQSGTITVSVFHLNKKFAMMNGHITTIDPSGLCWALLISKNYLTVVDNMEFDGHCRYQLYITENGHDICTRIRVRDFGYTNKNIGASNLPAGEGTVGNPITNSPPGGLSYGYGIFHTRNYSSIVRDIIGGHGWHVTDASRGQMHIVYDTIVASRNGFACSTHEGSWYVTWRNCSFPLKSSIGAGRCTFPTVENCKFVDSTFEYGNQAVAVTIRNCHFDMRRLPTSDVNQYVNDSAVYVGTVPALPGAGAMSSGYERSFIFENNVVIGKCRVWHGFASLNSTSSLIVRNNHYMDCAVYIHTSYITHLNNNTFSGVMGDVAVTMYGISNSFRVYITDNHEFGPYRTGVAQRRFIKLGVAGSPELFVARNNTTTATTLLFFYENPVTIQEVTGNSGVWRILDSDSSANAITVKTKANNLQGTSDGNTTITVNVNNTIKG